MVERMSEDAIEQALVGLPDWTRDGNYLLAEYRFADFVTAFGFMAEVALSAERLNHHPEWSNVYGTVMIRLTTHDVGGLSASDIELAQCVSRSAAAR